MQNRENACFGKRQDETLESSIEMRTLEAMAEFAAGVGHELNNPLAVISGLAQTLLCEEMDMNKRRSLSLIVEQTRQAYEMIASIRAFARPPMADARALAVREFFDDWTRRERTRLASLNVEVVAEGVELLNDVVIMSDPSMLCAILDAFGKNAFDALRFKSLQSSLEGSASGAERRKDAVIFFAELSGGDERSVILGVEDSGSGLSRKARELAFSPFYSGRRAGRGLGVGLSKAWRYAEVIGAKIFCEDAKNFDVGCRWSVEHTLLTTPFP